jgi:hypothetical protein
MSEKGLIVRARFMNRQFLPKSCLAILFRFAVADNLTGTSHPAVQTRPEIPMVIESGDRSPSISGSKVSFTPS